MTEATFTARIMKQYQSLPNDSGFEVKLTKTNSIPFSAVREHQIHNLLTAEKFGLCYKIRDTGKNQKPCDFIKVHHGWVVAIYWQPKVKHYYLIAINDWFSEMQSSKRKSLTESRAEEIGKKMYV